ncbi:metallopeptidase [Streptococcus troglodytae]|uniref:Metallopeptidase n=1 Tax=Streptococcus troglodytae TaxID=1111760 RepID=A0A1L7LGZ5_9STRE|nr:metallopeptidase [Streptococcus troglodytae]
MTIHIIRSDKIYRELLEMPVAKRRTYFKEQVLAPFKPKFYQQNIPYEAKQADTLGSENSGFAKKEERTGKFSDWIAAHYFGYF